MKQQKKQPQKFNNWDEVDKALEEIAIIDETNNKKMADYRKKEQERWSKITKEQQPSLDRKKELEQSLEEFAWLHKEELGEHKSKQLNHGKIFFRSTPPAVNTITGFTWEKVFRLIKNSKKWAERFIKIKEDIDKIEIKKASGHGDISNKELTALGITIETSEKFGYEISNVLK